MLATLTNTGKASIAKSIKESSLHIAWGIGDVSWDSDDAQVPNLINAISLVAEVGRRKPKIVGFVEPSESGDIIIPIGKNPDGSLILTRYQRVNEATPYLYIQAMFDFDDASEHIIREIALFAHTQLAENVTDNQFYYTPDEIADKGILMIVQLLSIPLHRSPIVREVIDFVFII